MTDIYRTPEELVLGRLINKRVPASDQRRQRSEAEAILDRLKLQPGVILADEVGMGKTFVALAVAFSIAMRSQRGPVIVMAPSNLLEKWRQDLTTFFDLYVPGVSPVARHATAQSVAKPFEVFRYETVNHSIDLLRLLDDPPQKQCHVIFLAKGAMSRSASDKWVRLALISEALRRHGRGKAKRLIQVKKQIHRFLARLIQAVGEERGHELGDALWETLLEREPSEWRRAYNQAAGSTERRLTDDPVPESVSRAIRHLDLKPLAVELEQMPVRARGGEDRVKERIVTVRAALKDIERDLWKEVVATAKWRSPLLIMDEAHHLKNPDTALARHFMAANDDDQLKTGDASLANSFERMLFLTATPFQLGHRELVSVMRRFGDVRRDDAVIDGAALDIAMDGLEAALDNSQRSAISLQKSWTRLDPIEVGSDVESWWRCVQDSPPDDLNPRERAVRDGFGMARHTRNVAEELLKPWVVRHNKGHYWPDTNIIRRRRIDGASMSAEGVSAGLPVPPEQLLPFFLAARSVVYQSQDLLGEALCSSYEAFRRTRKKRRAEIDRLDEEGSVNSTVDLSYAAWYLKEFDQALERIDGAQHPKMSTTVRKVVDLWESGEKVLVFAFYLHTCRALRIHISREIERRLVHVAETRLGAKAISTNIDKLWATIQKRFFDDRRTAGRRALDQVLVEITDAHIGDLDKVQMPEGEREQVREVMRRFLRVQTTLARSFPVAAFRTLPPEESLRMTLDHVDASGISWRQKFDTFIRSLVQFSPEERSLYLEAALRTQTGGIRVEDEQKDGDGAVVLANVQVATGETRRDARARMMRSFNTPFFPDILVCSEVMGEGVDLQRYCRHVIHHDLSWNPSTIEQRTGRIDRLACKAEGKHSIVVCLPYLAGTADERQYRVMSDRERWFRVVMGQEAVAELITPDARPSVPLPESIAQDLSFKLDLR